MTTGGLAISLAHRENLPLQKVPSARILPLLRQAGQILTLEDAHFP